MRQAIAIGFALLILTGCGGLAEAARRACAAADALAQQEEQGLVDEEDLQRAREACVIARALAGEPI